MKRHKVDLLEPDDELDELVRKTIGAAIEVYRTLGPGFKEKSYELALCVELQLRNIAFERQSPVNLFYKSVSIGTGYIDILVAEKLVLELKSVSELLPVHRAQTNAYLRAKHLQLGLLLNFNSALLKDGIERIINPFYPDDEMRKRFVEKQ